MSGSARHTFETSRAELERRWTLIRCVLADREADALVVQGANGRNGVGGHYHWLTGESPANSYPHTAILPREGAITLVRHGGFGDDRRLDPNDPATAGAGRHLGTPTFPSVHYTLSYDAELVAKALADLGCHSVAVAGLTQAYAGFTAELTRLVGGGIADITDELDEFKAQKSPFEIEMLRVAAKLQDDLLADAAKLILPGRRDLEVMADLQRLAELGGSEGGIFLGSSLKPGEGGVPVRHRSHQGRIIREGDLFFLLVENAGPGGMYVHASRYYALGSPPAELVELTSQTVEAQQFTASLLHEGASPSQIFAEYNSFMSARGHSPETRLHAHGQGYDLVERPLIRQDETLPIRYGLNIGIHPAVLTGTTFATMCDNFLFDETGVTRLHKFEQSIIEI